MQRSVYEKMSKYFFLQIIIKNITVKEHEVIDEDNKTDWHSKMPKKVSEKFLINTSKTINRDHEIFIEYEKK